MNLTLFSKITWNNLPTHISLLFHYSFDILVACFDFIASLSYQHDQTIKVRKTFTVIKDDMNSSSVSITKIEKGLACCILKKKNNKKG